MARVFSGIQPTGTLHLGNVLGAVFPWVETLHESDTFICVVDLHAFTIPPAPGVIGTSTLDLAASLIACGVDPERCTLFVQSHVSAHAELGWIAQCIGSYGELSRMTQFKEKRESASFISAGLFTYPALQAADVLLYDTEQVPVGDDQRQHIELCRDIAIRFNSRYGDTFVVPETVLPAVGARVMDLAQPTSKMSKSAATDAGVILLSDTPAQISKKFKRAVTDSDSEVRFDPTEKPGVSNLLSIFSGVTGRDVNSLAAEFTRYGDLKTATAEAVIERLAPVQERFAELTADPAEVQRYLRRGAEHAAGVATAVRDRAYDAIGLLRA